MDNDKMCNDENQYVRLLVVPKRDAVEVTAVVLSELVIK